ncbi:hypothetical protein SH661x_002070 [Planctomicrobium sp. SH661]|uniref:hypothetical protein n=1 Tax=Planctomicrobium sp. SH661 TaxID=3448124 RepID=UPI003F5BB217
MLNRHLATLAVLLLFPLGAVSSVTADEFSVEHCPEEFSTAMEQIANWRDSLDSLSVVYEWDDPQAAGQGTGFRSSSSSEKRRTVLNWQDWWIGADCQSWKATTTVLEPRRLGRRIVTGRTLNVQYFAEFSPQSDTPHLLTAADLGSKKTLQMSEQMPLFPIYFATSGWFSGAFEKFPVKYAGSRVIDGCRCAGVLLEGDSRPMMWLDLEHDGLPRLIEPVNTATRWTWKCDEFVLMRTGRWFPKSGSFGFVDQQLSKFHVESAEMNLPIAAEAFRMPEISKSTFVRDMTCKGIPVELTSSRSIPRHTAASAFSWWQWPCTFGMVVTSAGWFRWRRQSTSSPRENVG